MINVPTSQRTSTYQHSMISHTDIHSVRTTGSFDSLGLVCLHAYLINLLTELKWLSHATLQIMLIHLHINVPLTWFHLNLVLHG